MQALSHGEKRREVEGDCAVPEIHLGVWFVIVIVIVAAMIVVAVVVVVAVMIIVVVIIVVVVVVAVVVTAVSRIARVTWIVPVAGI